MKLYEKPLIEEISVVTSDVLSASGISVDESNLGFNTPDERI